MEGVNVENLLGIRQWVAFANYPMWISVGITYVLGIDTEEVRNRDRGHSPHPTPMPPRTCSGR